MSDGVKKFGIEFDRQRSRSYPYYDQELDYTEVAQDEMKTGSESATFADQSPTDRAAAKLRQYDAAAFLALEQAKPAVGFYGNTQVRQLPPVLNSVTATFYKSAGAGSATHAATDMSIDINIAGSGSLNPRSQAEASANVVGMVTWDIDNWMADAVVECMFWEFTDAPEMTTTQILAKLSALTGLQFLSQFRKKSYQIKILSGEVSIQQSADTDVNISVNTDSGSSSLSKNKGTSSSSRVGLQPRIETIPECIHDDITIASPTDSQAVSITVSASTPDVPATGSPIITAITNAPTSLSATANASVSPTSLAATTPADIPRTGLYITEVQAQQGELGTVDYRVTVVNFNQYA